ncbi:MAG TPA: DNA repair exonuclease [Tissierellales bacterium]|nr:DNA repair exonuclease [Tissierellales bacterium]
MKAGDQMIRFIHTGDIHLGLRFTNTSFGPEKGRKRREELWSSFQRLVSYAVEENIDLFLISGDLLEEDNFTQRDIARLSNILSSAEGVRFFIIAGNHDMLSSDSILSRWSFSDNVTVFKGKEVETKRLDDIGVAVHGVSWIKSMDTSDFISGIRVVDGCHNILMLHGDVMSTSKYMVLEKKNLESLKMDYIALGHIHKPMFIAHNIAYCGSLEGLDFGEPGRRGFILGEIGETNSFNFTPFSTREFHLHHIQLSGDMTHSDIYVTAKDIVTGAGKDDFHRILLSGHSPRHFNVEALYDQLEKDCYHIEIQDKSSPDINLDELLEMNEGNIIGSFIKSFTEEDIATDVGRRALYLGLEALLEGGSSDADKRD